MVQLLRSHKNNRHYWRSAIMGRALQAAIAPIEGQRVLQNGFHGNIANDDSREKTSTTIGVDVVVATVTLTEDKSRRVLGKRSDVESPDKDIVKASNYKNHKAKDTRTRTSHPEMDWHTYNTFANGKWGYKCPLPRNYGEKEKIIAKRGYDTSTEAIAAMEVEYAACIASQSNTVSFVTVNQPNLASLAVPLNAAALASSASPSLPGSPLGSPPPLVPISFPFVPLFQLSAADA